MQAGTSSLWATGNPASLLFVLLAKLFDFNMSVKVFPDKIYALFRGDIFSYFRNINFLNVFSEKKSQL